MSAVRTPAVRGSLWRLVCRVLRHRWDDGYRSAPGIYVARCGRCGHEPPCVEGPRR